MSILLNQDTRLMVQGITGRDGTFHAAKMKSYGTNIVAGTSPGKGGATIHDIPVYNTVEECVRLAKANTSILFVPAPHAKDAMLEAINAGVTLLICITEGIPTLDMVQIMSYAQLKGAKIIGPNCPGIISPNKCLAGIMPGNIFKEGKTGIISRSGTLTYEVVDDLTRSGIGQSTAIGIGGDPVAGLYYIELLSAFENDPDTNSIVLIGEIGGDAEEQAAEYIQAYVSKPVVAFIAGASAPPGKRMGHAGAIISGGSGTAQEKKAAFRERGIPVADKPSEIPELLLKLLI